MSDEPTPVLDGRQAADVLAELLADAPGYAPAWRPRLGRSGQALLQILARDCELVIGSLDQAPDKAMLAFLDATGIDLLPPSAARAPLVFELAPSSPMDSTVPQGTQVAAPPPPALPSSLTPPLQTTPAVPPTPSCSRSTRGSGSRAQTW